MSRLLDGLLFLENLSTVFYAQKISRWSSMSRRSLGGLLYIEDLSMGFCGLLFPEDSSTILYPQKTLVGLLCLEDLLTILCVFSTVFVV